MSSLLVTTRNTNTGNEECNRRAMATDVMFNRMNNKEAPGEQIRVGQHGGSESSSKTVFIPYQWCALLPTSTSVGSLRLRSKSTCSSMTELCAAANVIILDNFPLEFHGAQYGDQASLRSRKNIIQSPRRLGNAARPLSPLHTVSVETVRVQKTMSTTFSPEQRASCTRDGGCVRSVPCSGLFWYFRRFHRRAAAAAARALTQLRAAAYPEWMQRGETAQTRRKLCAPSQGRLLTAKQLNSHPVVQSDRPATPAATSVYVGFAIPRCPGGRSLRSSRDC